MLSRLLLPWDLLARVLLQRIRAIVSPMAIRTAGELEAAYGSELGRPPLSTCFDCQALRAALAARRPRVIVSARVCAAWLSLHRPAGCPGISRAGSSAAPRTAAQLEAAYGEELRAPPYSQELGCRALRVALAGRDPPVQVTDQVCRTWIAMHRLPPDAIRITSVGVLEERYGEEVRRLAAVHTKASVLEKVLAERKPPLAVTFSLLQNWLQKYGPSAAKTTVHSAGQLEMLYGERLRDEYAGKKLEARSIVVWLLEAECVSVYNTNS